MCQTRHRKKRKKTREFVFGSHGFPEAGRKKKLPMHNKDMCSDPGGVKNIKYNKKRPKNVKKMLLNYKLIEFGKLDQKTFFLYCFL